MIRDERLSSHESSQRLLRGLPIDAIKKRIEQKGELCAETLEKIGEKVGYLEKNKDKMLYGTFLQQGLFYGSGVVEAGCRAVIGKRLKQSVMFWSKSGAENILALRCALIGNRWEECWDQINNSGQFQIQAAA